MPTVRVTAASTHLAASCTCLAAVRLLFRLPLDELFRCIGGIFSCLANSLGFEKAMNIHFILPHWATFIH